MRGEFVDLGGTRLYYFATGTRRGGDPVVFLHGFPGSSHSWRLVTPLVPPGRRLVVVDLMGCGRSDGTQPGTTPVLTLSTHVALVRQLLDELSITSAALVGHGLGGAIAQAIAVTHRERVSALALVSSPAFEAWPRRLARLARVVSPLAGTLGAPLLASFVHGSALRGFADRDAGRRSLDQTLRAYPARLGAHALARQLSTLRDPQIADVGRRLGEIAVPTAVIWGALDPFLPASVGARLRDAIPGATLDIIPDAKHFVPEDAPERCAQLLAALLAR